MNTYLINTTDLDLSFSLINAGKRIIYHVDSVGSSKIWDKVVEKDQLIGCFIESSKIKAKFIFEILNVSSSKMFMMKKCFESEGKVISLPPVLYAELENAKICEIDPEFYAEICKNIQDTSVEIKEPSCFKPNNILFYGVPGCGKSYFIKENYLKGRPPELFERVVFHPDYTNSDFVGQILPKSADGKVTYEFIPGPFTRIMKKAYENPEKMHYLVIEEINRGNAPAIFGEIFQLLDRVNGESEYGINNPDIAKAIYGDETRPIKIPSNLTILATMNTADQNVFTLDTAFKRRWSMKSIPNDFEHCEFKDIPIGNTNVTWKKFAENVNYLIVDVSLAAVSSEDKRLGAYFATEEQLRDSHKFAEKVLAYLWDDVFKYDRGKLFRADIRTLDELIKEFAESGIEVFESTVKKTFEDKGSQIPVI